MQYKLLTCQYQHPLFWWVDLHNLLLINSFIKRCELRFLADRTNGRSYATVLPCVRLSSVKPISHRAYGVYGQTRTVIATVSTVAWAYEIFAQEQKTSTV